MNVRSLWQTDHTRQEVFEQRLALRLTAKKGDKTAYFPCPEHQLSVGELILLRVLPVSSICSF